MDALFDRLFANVSSTQRREILNFRETHQFKTREIAGNTWEYIDTEEGNINLVMVPGGMRRPHIGWRMLQAFEKRYRVIAPSYPTTGSMNVLRDGIISLLDEIGIHRFAIIGSSYGGVVAQCVLHAVPDRITHAILANTGTISENPDIIKRLERGLRIIRMLPNRVVTWGGLRSFKKLLDGIHTEQRDLYDALLVEHFARKWLTKKEFVCHYQGLLDFHSNFRFSPEDSLTYSTKVLLIDSSHDPGVLDGASAALREMYPNATTHTFLEGGHMPSISKADEFKKVIDDFLLQ